MQWNASGSNIFFSNFANPSAGTVGIGTSSPSGMLEIDQYYNGGVSSLFLNQPLTSFGNASYFNAYRFIQTSTATSDSNFRAFNVGAGGVAVGYSTTPTYGRSDALYLNGNVGIGTTAPLGLLDLGPGGGIKELIYGSAGSNSGYQVGFGVNLGQANNALSLFTPGGPGGTFEIVGPNQATWPYSTYTTRFMVQNTGNVGIGTVNPQYPLSVNGTIQAKEVLVNTGWSDYVFDPGYRLAPLSEVADYVQEHHHLPDMPSASEVAEKGVKVGEIESKLLAKIEELTLHAIRADKENRELRERLTKLESEAGKTW